MAKKKPAPKKAKKGRPSLYTEEGLDEWARAQLSPVVRSTAELAQLKSAAAAA